MKKLIFTPLIFIFVFTFGTANAVPILNESVANNEYIVIYPDSKDPNLYYLGANFMTLKADDKGVPLFSYTEYKRKLKKYAVIQSIMRAHYNDEVRESAIQDVLSHNPKARFATLPFVASKMDFNHPLSDLIVEQKCDSIAGQINDEMTCSFRLNAKGIKYFHAQMNKNLTMAMSFQFSVNGCLIDESGCTYVTTTHSVAARITSDLIKDYPELFRDHRGRKIKF